jgi:bifunctional UDP-N-acetylglucosamine pyrophosphorylase/glucosamine-1-phosphate N-acetyltransferase
VQNPYVQYVFDEPGRLVNVLQSREGDTCERIGFSDVGLFGLSVQGLMDAWLRWERSGILGGQTGEVNFLPLLSFLSKELAWPVHRLIVADATEARGVNTPEDLAFFRERLSRKDS